MKAIINSPNQNQEEKIEILKKIRGYFEKIKLKNEKVKDHPFGNLIKKICELLLIPETDKVEFNKLLDLIKDNLDQMLKALKSIYNFKEAETPISEKSIYQISQLGGKNKKNIFLR